MGEPESELEAEDSGELLNEGTSEIIEVVVWRRRRKGNLNDGRRYDGKTGLEGNEAGVTGAMVHVSRSSLR